MSRLETLLQKLKLIEPFVPRSHRQQLYEVIDELSRLWRDMTEANPDRLPVTAQNRARHVRKERAGKRHCPRHNGGAGAWLEVSAFDVKNKKTGALRSWCHDCMVNYQRERYLRVEESRVVVEVLEGDDLLRCKCPECGRRFKAGDRVVGVDLMHEVCA